MALICLGSVGAAPGVTTLSVLTAASWPRPAVLIEADPSGGVLAVRYRLGRSPGLAGLAAMVRQGAPPETIWAYSQMLPGDLPVVVAPESGPVTTKILEDAANVLARWCGHHQGVDIIVDCGRLAMRDVTWPLWAASDDMLLVTRPRADELYPVAHRYKALENHVRSLGLILVGDRPYRPEEVASQLNLPIRGSVADDPRAASVLATGGSGRTLRRSALVRSVRTLADTLALRLGLPVVSPTEAGLPETDADKQRRRRANRGQRRPRGAPQPPLAPTGAPPPEGAPAPDPDTEFPISPAPPGVGGSGEAVPLGPGSAPAPPPSGQSPSQPPPPPPPPPPPSAKASRSQRSGASGPDSGSAPWSARGPQGSQGAPAAPPPPPPAAGRRPPPPQRPPSAPPPRPPRPATEPAPAATQPPPVPPPPPAPAVPVEAPQAEQPGGVDGAPKAPPPPPPPPPGSAPPAQEPVAQATVGETPGAVRGAPDERSDEPDGTVTVRASVAGDLDDLSSAIEAADALGSRVEELSELAKASKEGTSQNGRGSAGDDPVMPARLGPGALPLSYLERTAAALADGARQFPPPPPSTKIVSDGEVTTTEIESPHGRIIVKLPPLPHRNGRRRSEGGDSSPQQADQTANPGPGEDARLEPTPAASAAAAGSAASGRHSTARLDPGAAAVNGEEPEQAETSTVNGSSHPEDRDDRGDEDQEDTAPKDGDRPDEGRDEREDAVALPAAARGTRSGG